MVKNGMRVGIDPRMISWAKAVSFITELRKKQATLAFQNRNIIDRMWTSKPSRPEEPVYVHGLEYSGKDANRKIDMIRRWISKQPSPKPSPENCPPKDEQNPKHVATLISDLSTICESRSLSHH